VKNLQHKPQFSRLILASFCFQCKFCEAGGSSKLTLIHNVRFTRKTRNLKMYRLAYNPNIVFVVVSRSAFVEIVQSLFLDNCFLCRLSAAHTILFCATLYSLYHVRNTGNIVGISLSLFCLLLSIRFVQLKPDESSPFLQDGHPVRLFFYSTRNSPFMMVASIQRKLIHQVTLLNIVNIFEIGFSCTWLVFTLLAWISELQQPRYVTRILDTIPPTIIQWDVAVAIVRFFFVVIHPIVSFCSQNARTRMIKHEMQQMDEMDPFTELTTVSPPDWQNADFFLII